MTVLGCEDITKSYRDGRTETQVLRGVTFSLEAGEVVVMEGPSGSGKTTLLQILGCILSPTTGAVSVGGRRVEARKAPALAELRRRHLGFVFQQFNLFPALTALENVAYALNLKGLKGPEARAQARELLEAVELSGKLDHLPRDLSGGQKQRIAIARALAGNPPVILADEPTANLDSAVGTQVLDLFQALARRQGRSLLIVTHDPKVRTYADRVVRIEDGRLFKSRGREL